MVKVHLVTLGCPKNEVDSAGMAALLEKAGHRLVEQPSRADVIVVNTCGFIAPARQEALEVLGELAAKKRPSQFLVAAGCMAGPYAEMLRTVPGVDALQETARWADIVRLVEGLVRGQPTEAPPDLPVPSAGLSAVHGASAYLKIAEGCSAHCAFCTIPRIKGPLRSFARQELVQEARSLVEQGVQEIVVVAQDTTAYGRDRGEEDGLPGLLEEILAAGPELPWLRLMYTYPGHISPRLIELMATSPQICPYLDIPLQHAHPATLRRMGRPYDVEAVRTLLATLRSSVPELALRTTFIVGYPGETDEEFRTLLEFIREEQFERVGVFTYYCEAGTPAAKLPGLVPEEVAQQRRDELMCIQQEIVQRWGQQQVGRVLEVLVEGVGEEGIVVGRTRWDAPEVDGLVLVQEPAGSTRKGRIALGEIVPVRITAASAYDLWGEAVRSRAKK